MKTLRHQTGKNKHKEQLGQWNEEEELNEQVYKRMIFVPISRNQVCEFKKLR